MEDQTLESIGYKYSQDSFIKDIIFIMTELGINRLYFQQYIPSFRDGDTRYHTVSYLTPPGYSDGRYFVSIEGNIIDSYELKEQIEDNPSLKDYPVKNGEIVIKEFDFPSGIYEALIHLFELVYETNKNGYIELNSEGTLTEHIERF